jgi:DNA (cytosine-5)-methyltransferase 1
MKIKCLSLFDGISGFPLGIQQAGIEFEYLATSEIDKYAMSISRRHYPNAEQLGSVTTIQGGKLPKLDLITFGFPCQDLSIAGKRAGLEGGRSGLFFEAIRIINENKPRYFIFENVKGIFSSNRGKDFDIVLRTIADIGYDGQWQLLNTSWFLPQNRERIYFVGHIRGECRPEVFPIGEGDGGHTAEIQQGIIVRGRNRNAVGCLDTRGVNAFDRSDLDKLIYPCLTPNREEKRQNGRRFKEDGEAMFTLTKQDIHGVMIIPEATAQGYTIAKEGDSINLSNPNSKTRRGRVGVGVANALDTQMQQYTPQRQSIRRLTPRECERLQGFPDDWTKYGHDGKEISDTQRYKCCGNAVSIPPVKAVIKRLYGIK